MDSAELHLAKLAHQMALMAIQAAAVYNQAQSKLVLHDVLVPERLSSTEGVRRSKDTVAALAELTNKHRQMFSTFMSQATAQILAAANELSPDRQMQVRESLIQKVNWNLVAQAAFYEGREVWIAAATRLLDLIEQNRDLVDFDGESFLFHSDELLEEFNSLIATLDAVHEKEVASLQERQARIAANAAKLSRAN